MISPTQHIRSLQYGTFHAFWGCWKVCQLVCDHNMSGTPNNWRYQPPWTYSYLLFIGMGVTFISFIFDK